MASGDSTPRGYICERPYGGWHSKLNSGRGLRSVARLSLCCNVVSGMKPSGHLSSVKMLVKEKSAAEAFIFGSFEVITGNKTVWLRCVICHITMVC